MHGPRAVALTAIAIGIGAVGMGLSWKLGRDESIEPETYIRYALVITLTVYALVGALVVTQLAPGLRLRWRSGGSTAGAIAFGVVVGGGLSAALLGIVSAASGHLAPDPRIVVLMSEGDLPHIIVTVALTCVCAPLVEEVLFRGLLLESLRERNTSTALVVSGAAFAV
ncbi:MAG: CPBP family intramembrane metalloprotease, partial [Frankiales bacterium]|nr:CPBP family intramembrane metalloprotease [Frankiales bacterium]